MERLIRCCYFLLLLIASSALVAQRSSSSLASTPPMGWNSWDSYGLTITEDQFKANVDWFNQHLKQFGWQYVVIDEGWYLQHPENAGTKGADQGYTMDRNGRYLPAPNRFPSGGDAGLKPIADYVHSMGLKFGIHIIRGIPKQAVEKSLPIAGSSFHAADAANTSDLCAWNPDNYGVKDNAAGQAWYNSLAKLYAGWGLDFIKVDCISSPYRASEIHQISRALAASGRPIILSLSPGPTPIEDAADVRQYAQLWRISNDVWDVWKKPQDSKDAWFPQTIHDQFALTAQWAPHVEPGHWPDADMLPLGFLGPVPGWGKPRHTRLTNDEARTQITLWCIARSPLFLGTNLTRMDAFTESLLTNPEVIAVDQHSSGNKPVVQTPATVVWTASSSGGKHYIAAFNISDAQQDLSYSWKELELPGSSYKLRDLWQRKDLGAAPRLKVTLAPHAAVLYAMQ